MNARITFQILKATKRNFDRNLKNTINFLKMNKGAIPNT